MRPRLFAAAFALLLAPCLMLGCGDDASEPSVGGEPPPASPEPGSEGV
ncbi:hypothetical protein [Alienimonas californiensis]|uniref:Uncharacterized protein n=1 Tax=Alienimonas californiensis TaxID=2527989 RepID=A0A517PF11_9PLAN|nr:hypothetical protein [Alienimonas californiensis]QDT17958.1 hypothetical protein CA12_40960 [Alienimonas californiensis]